MPATTVQRRLEMPSDFRSGDAAMVLASMDDQSRLLWEDLEGITPDELQWQPAPGMNTIGMLLTHLAVVEVWWTMVIVEKQDPATVRPVLAIDDDDDGMPMKDGAAPPAPLNGKDLAWFRALNDKARAYVRAKAAGMTDADLEASVTRTRPDGTSVAISGRWYLYHILEHFSGHYGQILLLRHFYRDRAARG
ncbi:MAG TPA: DinB family protein [Candidatus Eisenbacteria bacterium]|nr:DinB family protein [Candidatus Eisenbacteria bacterium]